MRADAIRGAARKRTRPTDCRTLEDVRRLIDASSDGPNSAGQPVSAIYDAVLKRGFVAADPVGLHLGHPDQQRVLRNTRDAVLSVLVVGED
jgi:hypothetical protein